MEMQQPAELRWRRAIEAGELGVWDLRPELETVHHSPQWKQRLGFPEPFAADSTHFWRCRVHPDDLEPMLDAMRAHARGERPSYEAQFRLRSNGSGYRTLHSRGRVVERDEQGRALRIIGTMLDLTDRPPSPRCTGLAEGCRGAMTVRPIAQPFHQLLNGGRVDVRERDRILGLVEDLLLTSLDELEASRIRGA
ncbi:PAS domain-containing protein [Paucibacter sp. R3-3]|uniref:histidine kinase n=1 Tax=Roseateles agri TaxID=3098619 RepID=A0ABU5DPP9_9BURK|nr:PAS domain-containing protein [Paucibacter sp. R3-3]MDY0748297.1 PAS domain-containing protein [Paucibacter sp. R3-3]